MYSPLENAAINRQLDKEVYKSKLVHSLDNLDKISSVGLGVLEISDEQTFEGKKTLKVTFPNHIEGVHTFHCPDCTRVRVHLDGEDIREYNRISFWTYPVSNGHCVSNLCFELRNEGENAYPRPGQMEGLHDVRLEFDKWSHVIWEIPDTYRDNVTYIQLNYQTLGRMSNMDEFSTVYISNLTLEKVDADKYSGWDTDGKIAFCHSGYSLNGEKTACCSVEGETFCVVDTKSGNSVFTGKAQKTVTNKGDFYVLDFSDLQTEGEYIIKYGELQTKPFVISDRHWDSVVDKLRNFFYEQRCGYHVEGRHLACHENVYSEHPDGRKLSVAGGWHDAADLSQGLCNTSEAVHAMLDTARKLENSNPELAKKLKAEAHWGAEWMLKTRFGDGYRCVWNGCSYLTSGMTGEKGDDFSWPAENDKPFEAFCAIAAEIAAYNAFKEDEPYFAKYCLKAATEDFEFVPADLSKSADASIVAIQLYAEASFAATELYKSTNDDKYLQKAIEYADYVLKCQQTEMTDWDIPMRGFFYEDDKKETPLTYDHRGHEQVMVMAMISLLEVAPNHENAAKWLNFLNLHREFILKINEFALPYGLLPAGVYSKKFPCGLTGISSSTDHEKKRFCDENFERQFASGTRLADDVCLRQMPMQKVFSGHFGVALSRAKGVSALAKFFNDKELSDIAAKQAGWVLGCNPFIRSYVYGEGYDFQRMASQYDMVGAIPVGIKAFDDEDVPFMPASADATYYEVYSHPASRLMWTISDLL